MGTAQNDVFSQLKLNVFVLCKICKHDRLCIMFSTDTLIRGEGIKPGARVKRLRHRDSFHDSVVKGFLGSFSKPIPDPRVDDSDSILQPTP